MKKTKFKMTGNCSGVEEVSESSCLCASVLKKDAGAVECGFNTETQRRRGTEFKMTEIGLIPEDWECCKIGELAKICTGNRNTQDKNDNGRYPFYVRSPIVERIDEYGFNTEGVVTVGDGVGTGKVFHYVNGCFGLHQRCYLIDSFNERLNAKYFYKVFSERFFNRVMQMTAKSSVDSVRREMISEMLIPVPPLSEQKKIAEALSDVDELLAAMTTLIEKKRAIKQGAMQELLGIRNEGDGIGNEELGVRNCVPRRRLPGFSGEWVEKRLGDCGAAIRGVSYKPYQSYYESGCRRTMLLRSNNIKENVLNYDDLVYVDDECIGEEQLMRCGDILICAANGSRNLVGKSAILRKIDNAISFGAFMAIFRTNSNSVDSFVGYLLQSESYRKQLDDILTGSAINNLNARDILSLLFFMPPTVAEQKAIAEVLSDMDTEIEALEAKRAKYESIKQGMMQELLTGKTRLV